MKPINKTIKISSTAPDAGIIKKAADIIHSGGVVLFPTQCLYGLAVNAHDEKALNRIFEIKQRSADNPLLVLIEKTDDLRHLVQNINNIGKQIMDKFWPGHVTVVFDARESLPANLTAGTGKIGVRQPGHPVAAALVKYCKMPITGTSANLSGQPGCSDIRLLDQTVKNELDLILDAGPLKGGAGSTVVDVTSEIPFVLRQGVVSAGAINQCVAVV